MADDSPEKSLSGSIDEFYAQRLKDDVEAFQSLRKGLRMGLSREASALATLSDDTIRDVLTFLSNVKPVRAKQAGECLKILFLHKRCLAIASKDSELLSALQNILKFTPDVLSKLAEADVGDESEEKTSEVEGVHSAKAAAAASVDTAQMSPAELIKSGVRVMEKFQWDFPGEDAFSGLDFDEASKGFTYFFQGVTKLDNDSKKSNPTEVLESYDESWVKILRFLTSMYKPARRAWWQRITFVVHTLWKYSANFQHVLEDKAHASPNDLPYLTDDQKDALRTARAEDIAASAQVAAAEAESLAAAKLMEQQDKYDCTAFYMSVSNPDKRMDVSAKLTALMIKNGLEDVTGGEHFEEVFGDAAPGESKKLLVVIGPRMEGFEASASLWERLTSVPKPMRLDLTSLAKHRFHVCGWNGIRKGDVVPNDRMIKVGDGYVGRSKRPEVGSITMNGSQMKHCTCHNGVVSEAEVLFQGSNTTVSWVPVQPGDILSRRAVRAGKHSGSDTYVVRKQNEIGTLKLDADGHVSEMRTFLGQTAEGEWEVLVITPSE